MFFEYFPYLVHFGRLRAKGVKSGFTYLSRALPLPPPPPSPTSEDRLPPRPFSAPLYIGRFLPNAVLLFVERIA